LYLGVDKISTPWYNKNRKDKGAIKMARLRLEKINGQWYLINKVSGKILARTTEETQKALRHIALTGGSQFTLEVV
jgi:hypothetical protein